MTYNEIQIRFMEAMIQTIPSFMILALIILFIFKSPFVTFIEDFFYHSIANITRKPSHDNQQILHPSILESGGYIVIEMDDQKRQIFQDVLKGFEDYAKLKGYKIAFSSDTSHTNMFAFKFTILEEGVTVSIEKVKNDIKEYLQKIESDEPLEQMPIVLSQEQHNEIITKLINRINFLKYNYRITKDTLNYYTNLISSNNITYPTSNVNPVINVITDSNPRNTHYYSHNGDEFTMEGHKVNGTGIVIGDNSKGIGEGSTVIGDNNMGITIGGSFAEKNNKLEMLTQLINSLEADEPSTSDKQNAIRYLKNIEEELKDTPTPDKSVIEKWFSKASTCIQTAKLGKELLDQVKVLYDTFSLSNLTAWLSNL
ncbi:MAG: hypothetical protein ABFC57_03295 [Veillonellales bacterium]